MPYPFNWKLPSSLRLAAWHKVAGRKHEITPEIIILGFILQTPSGKRYKINKIIIFIVYLILFKECLKYNIVPFIIEDNLKMFYYRGLKEWDNEKGYLIDTCLTVQDKYKAYLDYFRIKY